MHDEPDEASRARCAAVVKRAHAALRREARARGAEEAWREHAARNENEEYAAAMRGLAEAWAAKHAAQSSSSCRLRWIRRALHEYFRGGGRERARAKEVRALEHMTEGEPPPDSPPPFEPHRKIRALDVGSCDGRLALDWPDAEVLCVDLAPASPLVLRCDFVSVPIEDDERLLADGRVVGRLARRSFDAVVFSLLLEYLPSAALRLRCCLKARDLLREDGALCIATPDSKRPGANAGVYNGAWRRALADVGFARVKYEKLPHLHCMVFRKCFSSCVPRAWARAHPATSSRENGMCIPQDFNVPNEDVENALPKGNKKNMDALSIMDTFQSLPFPLE